MDPGLNAQAVGGRAADIASPASRVRLLVVPTDEELSIAQQTLQVRGERGRGERGGGAREGGRGGGGAREGRGLLWRWGERGRKKRREGRVKGMLYNTAEAAEGGALVGQARAGGVLLQVVATTLDKGTGRERQAVKGAKATGGLPATPWWATCVRRRKGLAEGAAGRLRWGGEA